MKRAAAAVAVLALLWSGSIAVDAQKAKDPLISPIKVTRRGDVSTTLTAPPGLKGATLRSGAVVVTENGVAQDTSVVRLPAEQLEVVLVVDTSSSMKGEALTSAKAAASTFISRLPAGARVALVSFGSTARVASPLVVDRNAAILALQALQAGGSTALFDAVRLGTAQFSGSANSRRTVVVLSDGRDTVSGASLKATTKTITAADAHLDVIELVATDGDHPTLNKVAAAGGGRVASANDPTALAGLYDGIALSLANQYTVRWRSSSHGATKVAVRVQQDGVVAASRSTVRLPVLPSVPSRVWMLVVGASCLAVALLLFGLVVFAPRQRRLRQGRLGAARPSIKDASPIGSLVSRATTSAETALTKRGWHGALNDRLEQAGLALRPGEFVVLGLSGVVLGFALGFVLSGLFIGVLLAGVAGAGVYVTLNVMRGQRRRHFSEQLGDTLQQLAGSLRAGYGLLQAVDALGKEASEPTSSEFRRLVVEARLGRDVSGSLHAMARRIGTDDFEWVVQAIDIHREVGGDLAEVLDTVANTIRERNQVMRQVKSLTAEGRLSAYILLALPVLLAGALRMINPTYFVLLTTGPGLFLAGTAVVMLVVGAVWFRKLCKLEY